jgi:hypothetical protein
MSPPVAPAEAADAAPSVGNPLLMGALTGFAALRNIAAGLHDRVISALGLGNDMSIMDSVRFYQ